MSVISTSNPLISAVQHSKVSTIFPVYFATATISQDALAWVVTQFKSVSVISIGLVILQSIIVLWILVQNGRDLRDYGCHFNNWRYNILDTLRTTIPLLLIALAVKYYIIQTVPKYAHIPLINPLALGLPYAYELNARYFVALFLYLLLVPFQEFLCRGATQTTIMKLFGSKTWTQYVICLLLPNLIFWVWHMHISFLFGFIAFLTGIYWSWLYLRQGSLLGPILSHVLIGGFILFILGINDLLYGMPLTLTQ